jgi:alanine-glyoxylate transaminase/(R)-3-amino-2-methylpropionate-pyruvate transaminase
MAALPSLPNFNHTPEPYTGPSKEEVIATRKEHLCPSIFSYYKSPLMLVEGKMQVCCIQPFHHRFSIPKCRH